MEAELIIESRSYIAKLFRARVLKYSSGKDGAEPSITEARDREGKKAMRRRKNHMPITNEEFLALLIKPSHTPLELTVISQSEAEIAKLFVSGIIAFAPGEKGKLPAHLVILKPAEKLVDEILIEPSSGAAAVLEEDISANPEFATTEESKENLTSETEEEKNDQIQN